MRSSFACLTLGLLLAASGAASTSDVAFGANGYAPRQYYGSWSKYPTSNAYYRSYYYKPKPDYAGYKHHYVIYAPKYPKHLYYYNPYKKAYWGRCDAHGTGEPYYSRLEPQYQKPELSQIPDSAFPQPGPLPAIPESSDGGKLDLPPDDLPNIGGAAPAAGAPPSAPAAQEEG